MNKRYRKCVVRRDCHGYAASIDLCGVTVLHLMVGSERNGVCAELIACALSELPDEAVKGIMGAVGAYRFLERLNPADKKQLEKVRRIKAERKGE